MNRFHDIIENATSVMRWVATLMVSLLLMPMYTACTDDLIPGEKDKVKLPADSMIPVEMPYLFGVRLYDNDNSSSRADDNTTSDGHPFIDGLQNEYALSHVDESNGEYFHYLLMYDKANPDSKPWVFPVEISDISSDEWTTNNVTLTVSKIFSNQTGGSPFFSGDSDGKYTPVSDLLNSETTLAEFKSYFENKQPYVLMNFKLEDKDGIPVNYYLDGNRIRGGNTAAKLSNLTQSDLQKLQLNDYKIVGKYNQGDRNFFVMTSSVYSDFSNKIIDGTFKGDNIFTTEAQARLNPGLTVYVERLASKITVSFNTRSIQSAVFDPYGNNSNFPDKEGSYPHMQNITGVNISPITGLPEIQMVVEKVDMTQKGGIQFNNDGYEIQHQPVKATLRILGYGLSNTESYTNVVKDINHLLSLESIGNWSWSDQFNHRSYWSRDLHYGLVKTEGVYGDVFKKVIGYPHQYRLALDTDSVTSYHAGKYDGNDFDEYKIGEGGGIYKSYNSLGTPTDETISGVYLNYKSFNTLLEEFKNYRTTNTSSGNTTFTFMPMYSLENTYYDPGQLTSGQWAWPWYRAPYGTATNLIIMAEIEFDNNAYQEGQGEQEGDQARDSSQETSKDPTTGKLRDVYLGQNNIFYIKKENLLKSKLHILNTVMLSGGNAGIQILHGQWDEHKRWADNEEVRDDRASHLDKVAWNEGSVLWFAKTVMSDDKDPKESEGTPVYEKIVDEEGKVSYKVKLLSTVQLPVTDAITDYLDLIPAEISGGDGQRLIAPHKNWMGMGYRYYLAPVKIEKGDDGVDKEVMDEKNAFEISYNHLVALIHKIIGPVDCYTEGKMYFSVPIPHRIKTFNNTNAPSQWKTFGAFSLVRNNWYDIQVTEFTKMGTPVDVLSQPIVPVMDVKRSYINMGVKVEDWHQVVEDNIPMM